MLPLGPILENTVTKQCIGRLWRRPRKLASELLQAGPLEDLVVAAIFSELIVSTLRT